MGVLRGPDGKDQEGALFRGEHHLRPAATGPVFFISQGCIGCICPVEDTSALCVSTGSVHFQFGIATSFLLFHGLGLDPCLGRQRIMVSGSRGWIDGSYFNGLSSGKTTLELRLDAVLGLVGSERKSA
jgi:hypothetical protein